MKQNPFTYALLVVLTYLAARWYGIDIRPPKKKVRFSITTVKINGRTIKGVDMAQTKGTFQDTCLVIAEPRDENNQPSQYQVGTEQWQWSAVAGDGSDATDDYESVTPPGDPNPLAFALKHKDGVTRESVANIVVRADGDPDEDESQDVVGTHTFVVDSPNTVAFEMSGSILAPATPA